MSSKLTTVWFSTAFKKSIVWASSLPLIWKALCKAIVALSAVFCSICPRVANLVAWITASLNSTSLLPAAATCPANARVSFTAIPYFVNPSANSITESKFCCVCSVVVNTSP